MHDSRDDFLERIYILYAHKLENMCLSYVNYQEVYRDIVDESIQKTFETATRQYKEQQDNPYLEGWLCQTCMNRLTTALRTYRRRMKKQMSLDDGANFTLPPEQIRDAMDEIINRLSNKELLDKILQALNDRERDIVQRHFVFGETVNEIAEAENTTVGAIKAVIARIRAKARTVGIMDKASSLTITYSNENKDSHLTYTYYIFFEYNLYMAVEQDSAGFYERLNDGTTVYITTNMGNLCASWHTDHAEFMVTGTITSEELLQIVDAVE